MANGFPTHYTTDPEGDEVFCTITTDWVAAYQDTSDTGPGERICSGCNGLLIHLDKPVAPHHIHLGALWFCKGEQASFEPRPDYTFTVGMNYYSCSSCPAAFVLKEYGAYPDGA